MSAYLKYFELEQSPFEGRAQAKVVLGTQALRDAFASIESGLEEGAARICVNGGAGLGKTSLSRALSKLLGDRARVAVVPDPSVSWESLRGSIARQWGLEGGGLARARLVETAGERRLVLVIDRAEEASEEFLDHLDVVLSYRSEDDEQVIHSVLFADLSHRGKDREPAPLVWWLDRIQTLQLEFAPLPRNGVESYIHKHLKRAGWQGGRLFTPEAAGAIHGYSGGIPGEVSELCERLLTEAASRGLREIDAPFVHSICDEEAQDEEPWTLDEAFEELALEEASDEAGDPQQEDEPDAAPSPEGPEREGHPGDGGLETEFADSTPSAPDLPTLTEAFEHFGQDDPTSEDAETIDANGHAPLITLERVLSAPPTLEELRAIRGGLLERHARAFAAAAIAAVLGGLALLWLGGDSEPRSHPNPPKTDIAEERAGNPGSEFPGGGPPPDRSEAPPVLARIRGPVTTQTPPPDSRSKRKPATDSKAVAKPESDRRPTIGPVAQDDVASDLALQDDTEAPAGDPEDDPVSDPDGGELIDLRPAAMLPAGGEDPGTTPNHFW